jgi:hypothetical protein
MATQQSDIAIQYANQVQSLVAQLVALRQQIAGIVTVNAANPLASNFWNVLNTTALAADGSLGTADGSPNTAHKIDSRLYPALNRSISATDLANGLQILVDLQTFFTGAQPEAVAGRPAQMDALGM